MRDKLIELIKSRRDPCDIGACPFAVDDVRPCSLCETESLAEHLIANGVTVQQWIPVSERLPTADDADRIGRVWAVHKGELPKAWHYTLIQDYAKFFTHWMPLPELPKEGE